MRYTVTVGYDQGERRYFVIASDIPGLNIEADTFEAFVEAAKDATPDLVGELAGGTKIMFETEVAIAS